MNWYVAHGQQEIGPYPFEQIRQMAAIGQLQQNVYIRPENGEWLLAGNVPGLFMAAVPQAPTYAPTSTSAMSAQTAYRGAPRCTTCGGNMRKERIYRLSGPAVVIGWILLIPSFIGITIGAIILIGGWIIGASAPPKTNVTIEQVTLDSMRTIGIREPVIELVKKGEPVPSNLTNGMTAEQRQFLAAIESERGKYHAGDEHAAVVTKGFGIFGSIFGPVIIIGSFIDGLLGWLLTMKKNVLRCTGCTAVVNAL